MEVPVLLLVSLFIIYKLLDRIVRIPKIDKPDGRMNNLLVTGCDTGFGNVFARRMAAKGFTVFAACLTEKGRAGLSDQYPEVLKPFCMDVSDPEDVRRGYQYVCDQLGRGKGLWAIVNNAGIVGTSAPAEWMTKDHYNKTLDVNLFGILQVTTTFAPLVKMTHGRVVNTCSIVGRYALPYSSPYVVSKYASEALSDSLRLELHPFSVSVHIIEPGFHATNLTDPAKVTGSLRACWDGLGAEMRAEYGEGFLKGASRAVSQILPLLGSADLSSVVSCYDHAVTARYPRGRYMIGLDARLVYWPLSLVPEWASDGLLALGQRLTMGPPAGVAKYRV